MTTQIDVPPKAPAANFAAPGPASTSLDLYHGRRAALALDIIVVGCGLGGLAAGLTLAQAGHNVTLLEAAPALGEVGAGIQVSPNVTRLLKRWGAGPQLEALGVEPLGICFIRYSTGEWQGYTDWQDQESEYGAKYYHVHRADFHKLLLDVTAPHVNLKLNSTVVHVDPAVDSDKRPRVTLQTGEELVCDVLIGADGVKSYVQTVVLGQPNVANPTGDCAYRAIIPTDVMLADPDLRDLVENPRMNGWMAPGRHLMAYCIRAKKEFNLVLLHPDDNSVESWTAQGSADQMREEFSDFEPRVRKLLGHVKSTLKWRLMDRKPIATWVHPAGRIALLGDACHPMLPYRAQGAAMAIEDAAVLGNLFSHVSDRSQITPLLRAYQDLRYERTAATQSSSRLNQHIFHLPDGPEQQQRDAAMRQAWEAEKATLAGQTVEDATAGNPNQWADKSKSKVQFGYDADEEAERWWAQEGERTIGVLAQPAHR